MNDHISASEYLKHQICPICGKLMEQSEYLAGVFSDQPEVLFIANMITHYRHNHIASWNRMWGKNGRAYQKAAKFGDYDDEKAKVNERAKRQIIKKCYPILREAGILASHFTKLENTTNETLAVANKYLDGKVEVVEEIKPVMSEQKVHAPLTDESILEYGKEHRGKKLANVPAEYLLWCYDNGYMSRHPLLRNYIEANMDVLRSQAKGKK